MLMLGQICPHIAKASLERGLAMDGSGEKRRSAYHNPLVFNTNTFKFSNGV